MTKLKQTQPIHRNEQGIVAIFTVLVIMGILTLLAIGFSNITRQAQKRALDDQLSTQAFYAAETGVNRAQQVLNNNGLTGGKSDCLGSDALFEYDIDTSRGIGISCLLINNTPTDVRIDNVPVQGEGEAVLSLVRPLNDTSPIQSLTIEWDSTEAGATAIPNVTFGASSTRPQLFPELTWGNHIGMMRIDLVPVGTNVADSLLRQNMVERSYSYFLYPTSNAVTSNPAVVSSIQSGTANQGVVVGRNCSQTTAYRCRAEVQLNGTSSNRYYVRMQAFYNAVRVRMTARTADGNEVVFTNSQAIVDSTGRVNDVSRRIQVRVPIRTSESYIPGYHESFSLLSASSICKRIIGVPNSSIMDPSVSDPACRIDN